jgi:hypothetical protein
MLQALYLGGQRPKQNQRRHANVERFSRTRYALGAPKSWSLDLWHTATESTEHFGHCGSAGSNSISGGRGQVYKFVDELAKVYFATSAEKTSREQQHLRAHRWCD